MTLAEVLILDWFQSLYSPTLNEIASFITSLGNNEIVIVSILFLMTLLLKYGLHNWALALSISAGGSFVTVQLLKEWVQRIRPETALIEISSYSFPSGHAAIGISLYVLIGLFIYRYHSKLGGALLMIIGCLIGLSRVYLGVHFPTDVIGGWIIGLVWLLVAYAYLAHHLQKEKESRPLYSRLWTITLIVFWFIYWISYNISL
ncbi:MAG: phosphatase PAP2 family protein [Candidatus Komeilibacteria bacterium]|nr:phosphatase PAP2 family protein [Candidatus Komeilibacteria bacterium]